jgi:hypothetical protein
MTTPAPARDIIVPSFQPGCMRAAPHKGRHAGRTEHAVFFIFVTLLSRPNEVIGKSGLMNQVWQGVEEGSLCFHIAKPSQGARRRKERHPLHHDGIWARLLLCGVDFAGRTTFARMNFKNCLHHAERFVTIVGSRGVRQRWQSQSSSTDERNSFVHLLMSQGGIG